MKRFTLIALIATPTIIASCKKEKISSFEVINRNKLVELTKANKKSKELKKRLELHFSKEGHKFSLMYVTSSNNKTETSNLAQKKQLLLCKTEFDIETVLQLDEKLKLILTSEELEMLEIQYKMKRKEGDLMYVSSALLPSYIAHETKYKNIPNSSPKNK